MLLVRKMNAEEREEGEITEYEDISSDEEILLRQRIAEIEATNLELEKLAELTDKVDDKENSTARRTKKTSPCSTAKTDVVALTNASSRVLRSSTGAAATTECGRFKHKPKPARRRRTYKRARRQSCAQLIISDDEFDTYDQQLPLGTENLSPDPLPVDDDDDDVIPVEPSPDNTLTGQQEDDEEDEELKLRLEALQSKQELREDMRIILGQSPKEEPQKPISPASHQPPPMDEEQELRLIALKSAVVKKHLARKKRKEEARAYSPTDEALESFDVPSPPLTAQNMDISPIGTPSPVSELENSQPVDMEIANEESQSPIFFACTINTEAEDPTALSRVEIKLDPSTMVADSGYDDEDPDKLRAFLLQKIGEAAKRKSMRVTEDIVVETQEPEEKRTTCVSPSGYEKRKVPTDTLVEEEEDEHVLRANLLSKAKQLKQTRTEESFVVEPVCSPKPLSEILNEQSKKAQELKTICRTIHNSNSMEPLTFNTPAPSPKPATPTRSNLVVQMPPTRVTPVIISLRESDQDSTSEFSEEDEENVADYSVDSPMSIAMDSPQYSSSPVPGDRQAKPQSEAFDAKLSEFLKKARDSTGGEADRCDSQLVKLNKPMPMKRIVTTRRIVKKVVGIGKTMGLASTIQLGAPASVKHLPPSTQLEYNRLINRMHQLERQKMMRSRMNGVQKVAPEGKAVPLVKDKPSPVKAPISLDKDFTVIRKVGEQTNKRPPITVLVHNNTNSHENIKSTVIVNGGGGGTDVAKKVPLTNATKSTTTEANKEPAGRISLKDRLKSLTGEQKKMLQGVQQRKVVNKRKVLAQALDTFLTTIQETMDANRQQIRSELEVRRLRRLLKAKEQQLAEQREKCNGPLHEALQGQYKSVVVARQSLATTSAQCLEIGRSVGGEGEEVFRLTDEGSEGLGAKFKKYKAEIEAYKELRGKIKKGVFTIQDLKSTQKEAKKSESMDTKTEVVGAPPEIIQKDPENPVVDISSGETNGLDGVNGSIEVAKPTEMTPTDDIIAGDCEKTQITEQQATVEQLDEKKEPSTFPVYKSPLDHMEYLDTANPNGILCPFELNGVCTDEKCSYRHLAS